MWDQIRRDKLKQNKKIRSEKIDQDQRRSAKIRKDQRTYTNHWCMIWQDLSQAPDKNGPYKNKIELEQTRLAILNQTKKITQENITFHLIDKTFYLIYKSELNWINATKEVNSGKDCFLGNIFRE